MIADLKVEALASAVSVMAENLDDTITAVGAIEKKNPRLAACLSGLLSGALAPVTELSHAHTLGMIAVLIAMHKTESANELQRHMVAGADSEPDRASPENPDGDGQQTAHDDSKTRE